MRCNVFGYRIYIENLVTWYRCISVMSKFREEFRIETSRLSGHDYSSDGAYFVTICTKNKKKYFGEIVANSVILSEPGLTVDAFWNEIPLHFPMVVLDAYSIMPDHIHGIIVINKKFKPDKSVETRNLRVSGSTPGNEQVETRNLRVSTTIDDNNIGRDAEVPRLYIDQGHDMSYETRNLRVSTEKPHMNSGSLSSIINQFKRICTISIRSRGFDFSWQSRFYDRIIRNLDELNAIRDYIKNNPKNWGNEL